MMITTVADYLARGCGRCDRFATPDCATQHWAAELAALRQICLAADLTETVKWGHPCYMHAGRNIAIIGALRGDVRLTFMNAALLQDETDALEPAGPNSQTASLLRFVDVAGIRQREPLIRRYLARLMEAADAGTVPPKVAAQWDMPVELVAALDDDPLLAEAFAALTPGRQRSWALHLHAAKTRTTRMSRIAKGRDRILAGKGAQER